MSEERRIKGLYLQICATYIDTYYTPASRDQIYARMSPDARVAITQANKSEWYPYSHVAELIAGIVAEHDRFEDKEEALRKMGKFGGEQAAQTFLRLLLKVLTMRMLLGRWPSFWAQYHDFGEIRAEMPGNKHMILFISPGYPWLYAISQGWVHFVCEAMGLEGLKVTHNLAPGQIECAEVRLDMTWR